MFDVEICKGNYTNILSVSVLFNALVEKDKEIQEYAKLADLNGQSQEYMEGYAMAITKVLSATFVLWMLEKKQNLGV